jgi:hypothetical protein
MKINQVEFKSIVKESLREAFYPKPVLLLESMNLYIKGANYKRYETLSEICNFIVDKIFSNMASLPLDQQNYWRKNHTFPTYDILTPDGPYFDETTGIINFYTSGLTRQSFILVFKTIFTELKKLGLSWGKITMEQSKAYVNSQVIRIPIIKNPNVGKYQGPSDLNLSNRNAYHIFKNVLQFEPDDDSGSSFHFKADDLIERINTLSHDLGWIDKHQIGKTDSDWPKAERDEPEDFENPHDDIIKKFGDEMGGARMIGYGLEAERIKEILREIWTIAKWAKDHGFEELYTV